MESESSLASGAPQPLLAVDGLAVGFSSAARPAPVNVLRQVSFDLRSGEILGLVGESGSGKTLTALAVLGLLPATGKVLGGSIHLDGAGDILRLPERQRQRLRGRRMAMIFQDPMSALNPVLTIGCQITEALDRHRTRGRRARTAARELLELVAMPDPERRLNSYPHQLSGGQTQRAMIAMALASGPDLLLADEPTTALDVTIQAQIIELLLDLRRRLGLTVLLITHDLAVVAECCDRVAVMYAGQIVEEASVGELFDRPVHPYTRGLLAAVPRLGREFPLSGIAGRAPEPGALPVGCSFQPRCGEALERCRRQSPTLRALAAEGGEPHRSRCFLHQAAAGVEDPAS